MGIICNIYVNKYRAWSSTPIINVLRINIIDNKKSLFGLKMDPEFIWSRILNILIFSIICGLIMRADDQAHMIYVCMFVSMYLPKYVSPFNFAFHIFHIGSYLSGIVEMILKKVRINSHWRPASNNLKK